MLSWPPYPTDAVEQWPRTGRGVLKNDWLVYEVLLTSLYTQVETYPLYAASSLAANAFTRCSFGGE